jgi:cytochrome c oxidase subunit 2
MGFSVMPVRNRLYRTGLSAAAVAMLSSVSAWAQDGIDKLPTIGQPVDGAMGFQPAATELARDIHFLDGMMLYIMTAIVIFVTLLLAYVAIRYNRKSNPTPARFTHNTLIEVTWTAVPVLILFFIGAFSLPILFKQQEIPTADITIKATGNQWFWSYDYVDHDFGFQSFKLERDQLAEYGYEDSDYLLATDTAVVLPVNKTIVVEVTGADVIHAWTVPAFGVKQDAVPGRLAHLWFKADKIGVYHGQCSVLCGKDHAYMPITVKIVSQEDYDAWLDRAIKEYAGTPRTRTIASAN